MSKVKLSVSVDDQHLKRFAQVVKGVKQAGMEVEQQLKDVGVITGSVDAAQVKSVRQVQGVAHVEESRDIQIAPPESDVQ